MKSNWVCYPSLISIRLQELIPHTPLDSSYSNRQLNPNTNKPAGLASFRLGDTAAILSFTRKNRCLHMPIIVIDAEKYYFSIIITLLFSNVFWHLKGVFDIPWHNKWNHVKKKKSWVILKNITIPQICYSMPHHLGKTLCPEKNLTERNLSKSKFSPSSARTVLKGTFSSCHFFLERDLGLNSIHTVCLYASVMVCDGVLLNPFYNCILSCMHILLRCGHTIDNQCHIT